MQSVKEEIKRTADIVQVIGEYVQLKKAGKNYMGLCPFHAEKSPSFTVSPDRQIFHCFGCKKGGDIFAFWMAYHGTSFPEAVRDLAERYNIPIQDKYSSIQEQQQIRIRDGLLKINDEAARCFEEALHQASACDPVVKYLEKRGLSNEIISEFRLGYAPESWERLTRRLKARGFDMSAAVQAGLIIPKKGEGHYDRFRGRLMFPIFNLRGQVIGFGGRVLNDALPKYLNTPETPVFHKGEFPYGLHASYQAIREKGTAVIVEGYMDLLSLRQYGLNEVVATLGTALTPHHIRKIKGYAKEAVVVFDSDEAGTSAALRSLPLFLNEGLPAKAAVLPRGHDPDTFVREKGLNGFLSMLDTAVPIFQFFLDQKVKQAPLGIEAKVEALKEILPVLSQVRNRVQRSLYAARLAERIGIKEKLVLSELQKAGQRSSQQDLNRAFAEDAARSVRQAHIGDVQVLNLLVHHPGAVSDLRDADCMSLLTDSATCKIVKKIFEIYDREGGLSPERLEERLESDELRIRFREALMAQSIYSEQEVPQAVQEIEIKARQSRLMNAIEAARGNPQALNQVLLELKALEARRHSSPGLLP
ncbi:MAG: DNA primase [Deltaproteobacteria bacterium]|nr:DNA primase [Deltaproteobacteria bacterium]